MDAKNLKLLVVDDNRDNLATLKAVLRDALPGTVVLTALDGARGIELARSSDPDVILLDIVMPGMDGFEVCRRLKADEGLRSIPVVFLTALRTDRESRVRALETGAEAFLSKPLDEQELVAQIRAMAKIKAANRFQRMEKEELVRLVAERTRELEEELAERKLAEARMRESKEHYHSLFSAMLNGFASCRMLFDQGGRPVDFIYLEVNGALETLTGLHDVAGRRAKELMPDFDKKDPELLEIYGRVATTGKPECFERYVKTLEMWFAVSAYSPRLGDFVAIFDNITERKKTDELIRQSLREKEALLKEVHHRVKNNLQVITSLLRLEAGKSQDEGIRAVLREMQARIRTMAVLHETLYRTGDFAQVEMGKYVRQLATQLFRAHHVDPAAVRLVFELSAVDVEIDQAIPCGLIVNELLTNALKHAFPNGAGGEVRVGLQREADGLVRLRVSDTGVGLPADLDLSRSASLGLQLVSDLTRQLQGRFDAGPGGSFTVSFTPKPGMGDSRAPVQGGPVNHRAP